MNFNKYHVSRNLFDANTIYSTYKQPDGTYRGTVNNFYLTQVRPFTSDDIGKTFTFTIVVKENKSTNIRAAANINGTEVNGNNLTTDGTTTVTFTVSSINDYLFLNYGSGGMNLITLDNIMLNTGSQPLPYEPYGNTWHSTPHYIHNTSIDTITTLPAVLYPNDTTATVGLQGNMVQSSQPSPTTPIQPSETGDKTDNMFNYQTGVVGGITSTGEIGTNQNIFVSDYIAVMPSTQYTSTHITNYLYGRAGAYYDANKGFISATNNTNTSSDGNANYTFSTPNNCKYMRIATYIGITDNRQNIMLNIGSTAKPFEPYGYKIPILNNSQTTNVYLGEVQSTRQITKYEFTGQEDWVLSNANNVMYVDRSGHLTGDINICYCSHYKSIVNVSSLNDIANGECCFNSTLKWFYIKDDNYTTQSAFLNYLQQQYANGTPVTVWYVLATPTTGIVNEPIRKIGTYADEVSGITIPTIAGANTLSIGTTLQPSEVTATYKGWHPVADVHERESNYTIATMQALTIAQLQTHTISELQGGEWS